MPTSETPVVEQNPVEVPLYTPWDAAHYLHLPVWTVLALSGRGHPHPEWFFHHAWRRWPHYDSDADDGLPFSDEFPRVSFRRLADYFVRAFVVQAARDLGRAGKRREDHWFRVHEALWAALESRQVEEVFGGEEWIDRCVSRCANLVPAADPTALRKLVLRRLDRVEVQDGAPVLLYPFTRDPADDSPRAVVIDPRIRFGRPTLAGQGVPTDALADRFHAGDSPEELAEDYDLPLSAVLEAIRYETLPVAPLFPPFFEW